MSLETKVHINYGKDGKPISETNVPSNAIIGDRTYISPLATLKRGSMGIQIGNDCIIMEGTRIGDGTILKDRVIVEKEATIVSAEIEHDVTLGQGCKLAQGIKVGSYVRIGECILVPRAAVIPAGTIDRLNVITSDVTLAKRDLSFDAGQTSLPSGCWSN